MRHDQYQPVNKPNVMDIFHNLPRDLRQDVLVKAEAFKNRANAQKPAGEKTGLRLRDAVETVMTIIFWEPAWDTPEWWREGETVNSILEKMKLDPKERG